MQPKDAVAVLDGLCRDLAQTLERTRDLDDESREILFEVLVNTEGYRDLLRAHLTRFLRRNP